MAKIFADVRLLMYLILVIFCDTKGFQLLNFATFFKLVLHGNKYIYQITNLLTVNKIVVAGRIFLRRWRRRRHGITPSVG